MQEQNKCVYLHKDEQGIVRYVGQGNKDRPTEYSKSKRNPVWLHIFKDNPPQVEIVATGLDWRSANDLESKLLEEYSETCCNIRPVTHPHEMTFEFMDEWFYIDAECPSGLRWKKQRPRSRSREGAQAGSILTKSHNKVYWQVKIFDTVYKVHRIVYLLSAGTIDQGKVIDHIDGDGTNNRVENLRLVNHFENAHNKIVSQNKKLNVKNVKESRRHYFGIFEVKGKTISLKVEKSDYPTDELALSALTDKIEALREQCISEVLRCEINERSEDY